jgi:hypothetical protein
MHSDCARGFAGFLAIRSLPARRHLSCFFLCSQTVCGNNAGRVLPSPRKPTSRRAATSFGRQSAVAVCTTWAVVAAAFALLVRSLVRSSSDTSKTRYSTSSKLPYSGVAGRGRSRVAALAPSEHRNTSTHK